mgnify:CR=1 FL=1|jgi:ParB-like chromosome segregation protein Spo0J
MAKAKQEAKPNTLKVEYVPVKSLKFNPKNPRKNDENVQNVVKSIEAFGWTQPILARRSNNMVIAGHTRVKAAIEKGLDKVPVIFLGMNEVDADVYMVTDNKLTENSEWDFPKLADLFVEFDQINVDLDLTGFSKEEVDRIGGATFEPVDEPQPRLDQLDPIDVKCPKCSEIFDARENKA